MTNVFATLTLLGLSAAVWRLAERRLGGEPSHGPSEPSGDGDIVAAYRGLEALRRRRDTAPRDQTQAQTRASLEARLRRNIAAYESGTPQPQAYLRSPALCCVR